MKNLQFLLLLALSFFASQALAQGSDFQKGDTLQLLSNLHPDNARRLLYTINYQQAGLLKACDEITVLKISRKGMKFDHAGVTYDIAYDGHTKKVGVSLQQVLHDFFGYRCDEDKMTSLGTIDQEGIAMGKPKLGMSKDGVLFAMGRPPHHATPSLDTDYWLYWRNKFGKTGVQFDGNGIVIEIK